jgi:hypothetical protein
VRESKIEFEVCKYAKSKGFKAYKWSSPGNRGVPDRIFMRIYKRIFFIEFKATGKKLSKLQVLVIKILRTMEFDVYVVDSIEYGKEIIDKHA